MIAVVLLLLGLVAAAAPLLPQSRSPSTPRPTVPVATASLPPLERPFPAPVTNATYEVPASIDATGSTDVSSELTRFIASVPDGSVIEFPPGGTYRIDQPITLSPTGRHNLVINGNGSTIEYVLPSAYGSSIWYDQGGGSNLTIEDFVLIGSSTQPGVYVAGKEFQYGVLVQSDDVEVTGCTISAVWGDGLFVEGSTNVWLHNNRVISAGRNGLSVISGTNIIAERNTFDRIGYVTFDDEPNTKDEASTNVIFRNNTAGTYGLDFAAVEGSHTGALIDGITISGNLVTGKTLYTVIDNGGTARMRDIVFTNNKSNVAGRGPILIFAYIDGLTVTGNVQPLTSGSLTRITNSTGVTYP